MKKNKVIVSTSAVLIVLILAFGVFREPEDISANLQGYNVIFINIDALRADHLKCYGYKRDTSPFIDSVAKDGLIFETALSNSSFTKESVSVLFSGRLISSGGHYGWGCVGPSPRFKNIGGIFKDSGYKTAIITNSVQIKKKHFRIGFDQLKCLSDTWGVSRNSPKLALEVDKYLKNHFQEKFFLYLHFLDPHGPYDPPLDLLKERFKKDPIKNPIGIYKHARRNIEKLVRSGFGPGDERFEDMVLRYDAEIAFVDNAIRKIFGSLQRFDLSKKTLVIISADHGEEFLEHGYVEHAWTLYNESLHIPLVWWAPGKIRPSRIKKRVSTVDILPTLIEVLNLKSARKDFDGEELFERQGDEYYFRAPEKPFIAEVLIQHRSLLRAISDDEWKYICAQKWLTPEKRPESLRGAREFERDPQNHLDIWGEIVHEELFDLKKDPKELRNVLPFHPEKQTKFKELYRLYKKYCKSRGGKPQKHNLDKIGKDDLKKLKTLGYL